MEGNTDMQDKSSQDKELHGHADSSQNEVQDDRRKAGDSQQRVPENTPPHRIKRTNAEPMPSPAPTHAPRLQDRRILTTTIYSTMRPPDPVDTDDVAWSTQHKKVSTKGSDNKNTLKDILSTATFIKPTGREGAPAQTSLAAFTSDHAMPTKTGTIQGVDATSTSATSTDSDHSQPSNSNSNSRNDGTSTVAAKIGIAIGAMGGVLIIALIIFFFINRRKKQKERQRIQVNDDEKHDEPFGNGMVVRSPPRPPSPPSPPSPTYTTRTARTVATAPRLSLRPVTQFLPNFGERRSSKGAAIALSVSPSNNHPTASRLLDASRNIPKRPSTGTSSHYSNPFDNEAERGGLSPAIRRDMGNGVDLDRGRNGTPVHEHTENAVGMAQTVDLPADIAAGPYDAPLETVNESDPGNGNVTMGALGSTLGRRESTRKQAPEAIDLTRPVDSHGLTPPFAPGHSSPTGTEFSFTSVATGHVPVPSKSANAIAAAGGPSATTVHRVQLDFKPTLDDEMELRAGQLVRLLHEYDDGWALCIRLDRSQQGVVPRTCLSLRQVKPRPAGGPLRNGNHGHKGPRGPPPLQNLPPTLSSLRTQSPVARPSPPPLQSPASMQSSGSLHIQSPGFPLPPGNGHAPLNAPIMSNSELDSTPEYNYDVPTSQKTDARPAVVGKPPSRIPVPAGSPYTKSAPGQAL